MKIVNLQKLPLGISTFSTIRNEGLLYVDKTQEAYNLITRGARYFLSRPRRFGKSLLVSTLKEILSGNQSLFKDLWIEKSDYEWKPHGVITLNFSELGIQNVDTFSKDLSFMLSCIAQNCEFVLPTQALTSGSTLSSIVRELYKRFGKVAILIDEYDSPILRALGDQKKAEEIRDLLQHFFTVIKGLDEYLSFTFITGVSSFAKAGIFSGMNNLDIITLDKQWATICGYTDQEIDYYFPPHLHAWADQQNVSCDELRQQLKYWYNGYRFGASVTAVYNPFSFMHALNKQECNNFWIQSGTPSFLIKEINKNYRAAELQMLHLESFEASVSSLGTFDIGATPLISLLFQSGYLTIARFDQEIKTYILDYPNYEVRTAMELYFLSVFVHMDADQAERFSLKLHRAFVEKNIEEIVALIKSIFTRVPYQTHIPEERYYHGLLHVLFAAAGLRVHSEQMTSHARIDMVVELSKISYVIELKFNQTAEMALQQIEDRKYYDAVHQQDKPIILLGLNFCRKPQEFDITYAVKEVSL